jgi:integrase
VVLQGLTGMRASELIGLEAADLTENGSPVCLRSRLTRDGAFEVFELHGKTTKGRKRQTYWVIGARPTGSSYEPPPVRAVRVLARLLEPWRRLGGRTTLLVTFSSAKGLPRQKGSIGRVYSGTLTYWQKEFCNEHVDLTGVPDAVLRVKPAHMSLRGHRWRPTFAVYMYRVHSGLVPALADHFKHSAQVMTEHGYIGNNPSILDAMDAARVQSTAMMLLQLSSGSAPAAGPAARFGRAVSN